MIIQANKKAATQSVKIRTGQISGWGDSEDTYNVELVGGVTLYSVAGPSDLSVTNWVIVSTDGGGKHSILSQTAYDSTEIVEVEV